MHHFSDSEQVNQYSLYSNKIVIFKLTYVLVFRIENCAPTPVVAFFFHNPKSSVRSHAWPISTFTFHPSHHVPSFDHRHIESSPNGSCQWDAALLQPQAPNAFFSSAGSCPKTRYKALALLHLEPKGVIACIGSFLRSRRGENPQAMRADLHAALHGGDFYPHRYLALCSSAVDTDTELPS